MSLLLSACPDAPSHVGTAIDLTKPSMRPSPRTPLEPLRLTTQADFDALEQRFDSVRDPFTLIAILERLAATAKPAEREADILLLVRLAMLYIDNDKVARETTGTNLVDKALAIGTRLRKDAPKSPHTLFLQGYIPYASMDGTAERPLLVMNNTRQFVSACGEQWRALTTAVPDYDGPRTLDHARLREIVAAIDAALAALPGATTPPPEAIAGAPVSRTELDALNQLARFEGSSDGDRKAMCRDWDAARAKADPKVARSQSELALDLDCAIQLGKPEVAVPLIVRLREQGPAFDACLALAALRDRAPDAAVAAAQQSTPIDCPPVEDH